MLSELDTPTPAPRPRQTARRGRTYPRNFRFHADGRQLVWYDSKRYTADLDNPHHRHHIASPRRVEKANGSFDYYSCTVSFVVSPYLRNVVEYALDRYCEVKFMKGKLRTCQASNDAPVGQRRTLDLHVWDVEFRTTRGERSARDIVKETLTDSLLRVGPYAHLFPHVHRFLDRKE